MDKNWQEISLGFFREIAKDYYSEKHENYQNIIIELMDPTGSRRMFMDNLSHQNSTNKLEFLKENCSQIPEFLLECSVDGLGGVFTIATITPYLDAARGLLDKIKEWNIEEFLNKETLESFQKLTEKTTPNQYPIIRTMLDTFLVDNIITSVPPNEVNISGGRLDPLWYKKSGSDEISGSNLTKEDWDLSEDEKLVKIRVWSVDEYNKIKEEL